MCDKTTSTHQRYRIIERLKFHKSNSAITIYISYNQEYNKRIPKCQWHALWINLADELLIQHNGKEVAFYEEQNPRQIFKEEEFNI